MNKASADAPKVAIVHDWLYGGGAEKVVEQLHTLYPNAPIYTVYSSDEWRTKLNNKVVTGYLQRWPFSRLRRFTSLLQVLWFRRLNLSDYDVIISSTGSGHAKQIRTNPDQTHICYCNTPPHYLWEKYDEYMRNPGFGACNPLVRLGLRVLLKPLRALDYKAAQKVDRFMANSTHIQTMIKKHYGAESEVVFPPVDTEGFTTPAVTDKSGLIYFGRHVAHKRIDLVINACNELGKELVIVGTGPETPRLQAIAGPTVTFKGRLSHDKLVRAVARAEAFVFPNEEDFGIVAVEAQAAGTPVIAYRSGGSLDTVVEGVTGEFFDTQTVHSLAKAIEGFNHKLYNRRAIIENAHTFSQDTFKSHIKRIVTSV